MLGYCTHVGPSVKRSRRYHSPRRREQAEATRTAILQAAQRLFERDGYVATPVPAVAAEARVAVKTVHLAFGTKANLLRALWEQRLAGDEAATPVMSRRWYQELQAETHPAEKLRLLAKQSRAVKGRSGPLLEVIRNAAAVEPEIAPLWTDIETKLHDVASAVIQQLRAMGALRADLDPSTAADVLWVLHHPAVWQLLVCARGWSPERYERWLANAYCRELLHEPDLRSRTST